MEANKPHAVCMPSPAQGHINAMLQLAKLLHSLYNFHITFVHTRLNFNRILSTSGDELSPFCSTVQNDLNQPSSFDVLPDFRCEAIQDGLQRSDPTNGEELTELCDNVRNNFADHFRQLVKRLNENGGPKVTCIVSDTYSSFTLDIAAEFAVPDVSFCSVSACGFWGFFRFKELLERGIVPLKSEDDLNNGYLETCIDWIPGKSMRLRDFSSFVRTTNPNDSIFNFCKDESQDAKKANAIIINTFNDLEAPVLDAMSAVLPPIYAVGPLTLMCDKMCNAALKNFRFNLWQEDSTCLQWLDRKANGSVIYVNFGSLTVLSSEQLVEFAWGLANSGHEFLWVIRPNIVSEDLAVLLQGFSSAVSERGLLTSWCPQGEVLMHPAIGVFLTHCGWNSTMESISRGIPMICWPYFGDQQTNCYYVCNEWGIGVEIGNDVKRQDVEGLVREILGGEKGKEMREMTLKWKESAIRSTEPGGKSFMNLEKVIKEVLLQENKHV